ncbi:MAG TPA: magnesium transporter [Myxococcaceae bacterium]|nr:magnesium transporter [Myxococcaceae bacterium]
MIRKKDYAALRDAFASMDAADISEVIEDLPPEDSGVLFRLLPRDKAAETFEYLPFEQQSELVGTLGTEQLVNLLNEMAADDRTRLLEELPAEVTRRALRTLTPDELKIARQLLGYPEKSAGRFMTPEYLAIRPQMTASEALQAIRERGKDIDSLNVIFVSDEKGLLLDDVRLSSLVLADPDMRVSDIQDRPLVSIPAMATREEFIHLFEKYDRVVLPVTDSNGVLVGIITADDVLDAAEEEATEDIHRLGGMEALDTSYMGTSLWDMVRKRGGWLTILFLGQMLTAGAMTAYQGQLEASAYLAIFIPLILSSGGNSGSQATSLIIRALAVRDLELSDWWRVALRELASGLLLGLFLGMLGILRVVFWPEAASLYGGAFRWVGLTVGCSVLAVVIFGTLSGSMLPFMLRRLGLDPATASAPFVSTLVDVAGVSIYFTTAMYLLSEFA